MFISSSFRSMFNAFSFHLRRFCLIFVEVLLRSPTSILVNTQLTYVDRFHAKRGNKSVVYNFSTFVTNC